MLVARSAGPRPRSTTLDEFLNALDGLATRPAAEIDRALRGSSTPRSHRFDAWVTVACTAPPRHGARRAARAASTSAATAGSTTLRPDPAPDSLGYVHAPSLPARGDGRDPAQRPPAHRDAEHETLDIQLSSDRVQRALPVHRGRRGRPAAGGAARLPLRALAAREQRPARALHPPAPPLRPAAAIDRRRPPAGRRRRSRLATWSTACGCSSRWRDDRADVLSRDRRDRPPTRRA